MCPVGHIGVWWQELEDGEMVQLRVFSHARMDPDGWAFIVVLNVSGVVPAGHVPRPVNADGRFSFATCCASIKRLQIEVCMCVAEKV